MKLDSKKSLEEAWENEIRMESDLERIRTALGLADAKAEKFMEEAQKMNEQNLTLITGQIMKAHKAALGKILLFRIHHIRSEFPLLNLES